MQIEQFDTGLKIKKNIEDVEITPIQNLNNKKFVIENFRNIYGLKKINLKKNLLKSLLESSIQLEERGWELLNKRWMIFFIFLAFLNEIVWRTQTEDFWVKFKVFGIIPITFIFMIFQINLIKKYSLDSAVEIMNHKYNIK